MNKKKLVTVLLSTALIGGILAATPLPAEATAIYDFNGYHHRAIMRNNSYFVISVLSGNR